MAQSILDHVTDVAGTELVRLSRLYEFPDFVKKAGVDKVCRARSLPVTAYADPVHRYYPCDTAASTWLSALYFTEKQAEFHPKDREHIQDKINEYGRYWRIEDSLHKLAEQHKAYIKEAETVLPDSSFAYVSVNAHTGQKERRWHLRNAMEVKAAAENLATYRDRFTFADRHAIANRILDKAAELGAALSNRDFLEKQAGMGVGDPKKIASMINDRALLATTPIYKQQLLKLAEFVRTKDARSLEPSTLSELCETVDKVDRELGLVKRCGADIAWPEDVIFGTLFSKAAEEVAEAVALTSGSVYKRADLAQLPLDTLRNVFGEAFAEDVKSAGDQVDLGKLAEVIETLPRDSAELFDNVARSVGVNPRLRGAAAVKQGFTREDYQKLADAYTPVAG